MPRRCCCYWQRVVSVSKTYLLGADKGLLHLLSKEKLPSPDAARQFLLSFHDEGLIEKARAERAPDELSVIVPESCALEGLGRVNGDVVRHMQRNQLHNVKV